LAVPILATRYAATSGAADHATEDERRNRAVVRSDFIRLW
jgi:hypothetical protein